MCTLVWFWNNIELLLFLKLYFSLCISDIVLLLPVVHEVVSTLNETGKFHLTGFETCSRSKFTVTQHLESPIVYQDLLKEKNQTRKTLNESGTLLIYWCRSSFKCRYIAFSCGRLPAFQSIKAFRFFFHLFLLHKSWMETFTHTPLQSIKGLVQTKCDSIGLMCLHQEAARLFQGPGSSAMDCFNNT